MKIETQQQNNIEQKELNLQETQEEKEILNEKTDMPFSNFIALNKENNISSEQIKFLSSLPIDYNYDHISMSFDDAMFFVNLTQEGQFIAQTNSTNNFQNLMQIEVAQTAVTQKTIEVSNKLTELIQKAQTTQKPVRISFDNDMSVILKIDKNGKVTAEFIPGSIEVENYLRNNIDSLKQKFEEQNLPYNDLFYRQNNRQQNKKQNKENKGEK